MNYDSSIETLEHIKLVAINIDKVCDKILSSKDTIRSLEVLTLVDLIKGIDNRLLSKDINNILSNNIEINGVISQTFNLEIVVKELQKRKVEHDQSKLYEPEKSLFDIWTPSLRTSTYGSDEYKMFLKELKVALEHHYSIYRHHPEHFLNGINDMHLIDLIEMICDWEASSKRYNSDNIFNNIDFKNKEKFGYSDSLSLIFKNTISKHIIT